MLISLMSCGKAQASGIGESVFEWEGIRERDRGVYGKYIAKFPFPNNVNCESCVNYTIWSFHKKEQTLYNCTVTNFRLLFKIGTVCVRAQQQHLGWVLSHLSFFFDE